MIVIRNNDEKRKVKMIELFKESVKKAKENKTKIRAVHYIEGADLDKILCYGVFLKDNDGNYLIGLSPKDQCICFICNCTRVIKCSLTEIEWDELMFDEDYFYYYFIDDAISKAFKTNPY